MLRLVLLRLSESFFRHPLLYTLPTMIMAALAGVYLATARPTYIASGSLFVQDQTLLTTLTAIRDSGLSWTTPAQVTLNEVGELLQTRAFVRAAISRTPLEAELAGGPDALEETIERFRESVWAVNVGESLVSFNAKDEDPEVARQLAAALMDSYVQWKLNDDRQEGRVAQRFFSELAPTYEAELQEARDALSAYLAANPDPTRGERPTTELLAIKELEENVDRAAGQLASVLEKEESARLSVSQAETNALQNYLVIDAPELPLKPARSLRQIAQDVAIFLAAGLFLSAVGVAGGAVLDRSLRFPIDVRHGLGLPVLASLPDTARRGRRGRRGQRAASPLDSPAPAPASLGGASAAAASAEPLPAGGE